MEQMALYKRVIALDIHQAQITACALIEATDGSTRIEQRQFGDRRELADWVASLQPDEVVMESTGIYWKSPYAALEAVGIRAKVVNARHVKNVPGRKTDVGDAHWLATLARAGLLRGSFVPPAKLRELRLIARQRQKLVGQLASEKNRLHKVLTDSGIRLGVVVSDLHGKSARAMVKAIIAGLAPNEVLKLASVSSRGMVLSIQGSSRWRSGHHHRRAALDRQGGSCRAGSPASRVEGAAPGTSASRSTLPGSLLEHRGTALRAGDSARRRLLHRLSGDLSGAGPDQHEQGTACAITRSPPCQLPGNADRSPCSAQTAHQVRSIHPAPAPARQRRHSVPGRRCVACRESE